MILLPIKASAQAVAEGDLKAAIIVNMLLFVETPADAGANIRSNKVCYLDDSPVSRALQRLDGKIVKGQEIRVERKGAEGWKDCQAIYFSSADAAALATMGQGLSTAPVLVVGDSPGYLERGVMLNMELQEGFVVFDINLLAAKKAGVMVSSKVLRLARKIIK